MCCKIFCRFFYEIDINNFADTAVLAKKLARKKLISGVYTQGTDAEYTVAFAASEAGLFGIGPEIANSIYCSYKYCYWKDKFNHYLRAFWLELLKFANCLEPLFGPTNMSVQAVLPSGIIKL